MRGYVAFDRREEVLSLIRATLRSELPASLEIGDGNVLVLEGTLDAAAHEVRDCRLSVGEQEVAPLVLGVPAPGEITGGKWWRALVPLPPVAEPQVVTVALRARVRGGPDETVELGSLRLEPGPARPKAPSPSPDAEGEAGLVAICLATYDPPLELLRAQIESIRSQTHERWICIVSDDSSPVAKWQELMRIVGGDERFQLMRADRRVGFYRNFERALRSVPDEAAYVAFADQDDRWDPEKLESLIAGLGATVVLAHSDARVVDREGRLIYPTFWPRGTPGGDRLGDLLFGNSVSGAACLFRRSVLDWALPFPALAGTPYHDRWVALVASVLGPISRVERPLYDYVQHGASALGHSRASGLGHPAGETRLQATTRRVRRLRDRGFQPDWREAHNTALSRSVTEAQVLRLRLGTRMSAADRRAVAGVEALPRSLAAQARLAGRHLVRAPRRRPGLEGALLRGIAWGRLAPLRSRLAASRAAGARPRRELGTPRRNPPPPRRRRAGAPVRVGITVTSNSEGAGFGDFHTAHELGAALAAPDLDVAYLELQGGRWQQLAGSVDVLISLLDRFPLERVPARVESVAWVRNWTERWISRPWFEEYDTVLASSQASVDLIGERTSTLARLMPLATNPERFRPVPPEPGLRADMVFTGNHWGAERQLIETLREMPPELEVKVFGRGWEAVPVARSLHAGALDYDRLPWAYSSALLVVDDSAHHAKPYGAVNSRVFDALACGTLVTSNDAEGVRTLFGEDFPAWHDAVTLRAHAEAARDEPAHAVALAASYREEVLARHTYAHRAGQVREALGLPARV